MKRCPMCDRTYDDDAQTFCVNDGATLVIEASASPYDPMKTIVATPPPQSQSAPLPPPGYGSGDLPGGQAPSAWQQPPPQTGQGWGATPAPQQMGVPPTTVPNYLVPAIVSTLCCCLPFGIVSIIFATQVNSKLKMGDIQGAMDASAKAKMWFIIAIVAGVIVNAIALVIQIAAR